MNKVFYKSVTFWGAIAWALVGALEQLSTINPGVLTIAGMISSLLLVLGIRRALP